MIDQEQKTRLCKRCLIHKDISEFRLLSNKYRRYYCLDCEAKYKKELQERYKTKNSILSKKDLIKVKKCSKCKKELSSSNFYRNHGRPDGLNHYCKKCMIKSAILYSRTINPIKKAWKSLKQHSKNPKKYLDISSSTFLTMLNKPCYYCERLRTEKDGMSYWIDRIDNTTGYTQNNILPCCPQCNRLRMDNYTVEETRVAAQAIKAYRELKVKIHAVSQVESANEPSQACEKDVPSTDRIAEEVED